MTISMQDVVEMYQLSDGMPVIMDGETGGEFHSIAPGPEEKNAITAWMVTKENILGMIRVSSKEEGFSEEDSRLLVILASHMSVAMENAELYSNLQARMVELRETQEQLIQSAKLAAIGELASNVAHEINNPLTSIIGFTELSKEDDDIEAIRKSLDIIEKESLRARDIVKQLLNFARKKPLNLAEIMINDIIREVISFSSSQTRMGRVKVIEELGELPPAAGDADQLKQVFLNLITNSIHAMPDGGTLRVATSLMGEYILTTFSDTGHGIPETVRQRIFEPFFTTKKEKGTGLGLSISYRIIQDHGGRIDVESEEGKGTTFIVRLPKKT
jgi:two-component system NtrC family sensor kinase